MNSPHSIYLSILLLILSPIAICSSDPVANFQEIEILPPKKYNTSITVISDHPESVTFYPGDYMGDLKGAHLILEPNCDLVLYDGDKPTWTSNSTQNNNNQRCKAIFQPNGDLVVYSTSRCSSKTKLSWASGTNIKSKSTTLELENGNLQMTQSFGDDDNITIHISNPSTDATGVHDVFGQTGTTVLAGNTTDFESFIITVNSTDRQDFILHEGDFVGDRRLRYLILQDDCNLVLYIRSKIRWMSGDDKTSAAYTCEAAIKRDGNIIVYAKEDPDVVFWSSGTAQNDDQNPLVSSELRVVDVSNGKLQLYQKFQDGRSWKVYNIENLEAPGNKTEIYDITGERRTSVFADEARNRVFSSITVNSNDEDDFIMYQGDFLGNLSATYLILGYDCVLYLYAWTEIPWSSESEDSTGYSCELAIRRDGNIIIYAQKDSSVVFWSSETTEQDQDLILVSSELRVVDGGVNQQGNLLFYHYYEDGSQNIYNTNTQGLFTLTPEPYDLLSLSGVTAIVSNRGDRATYSITVNSTDEEDFIIYEQDILGDLNSTYLTLEYYCPDTPSSCNCRLVLYSWSYITWKIVGENATDYYCRLAIKRDGSIVMYAKDHPDIVFWSSIPTQETERSQLTSTELRVIDGITDSGQTGEILFFHNFENGASNAYVIRDRGELELFIRPHDISGKPGVIVTPSDTSYMVSYSIIVNSTDNHDFIMHQGDYLGDIKSRYLILKANCELLLYEYDWESKSATDDGRSCDLAIKRDGNIVIYDKEDPSTELWASENAVKDPNNPLISSELAFFAGHNGTKTTYAEKMLFYQNFQDGLQSIFDISAWGTLTRVTKPRNIFGKSGVIVSSDKTSDVVSYSIIVNSTDKEDFIMKGGEFLGDLNAVYLLLKSDCNLIWLVEYTQISWESGSSKSTAHCELAIRRDGNIVMYDKKDPDVILWSSGTNVTDGESPVVRSELKVVDGDYGIGTDGNLLFFQYFENSSSSAYGFISDGSLLRYPMRKGRGK